MPAPAFRLAASAIGLLFWLLAIAHPLAGWIEPFIAGFAAAMVFNAVVPHLALSTILRRYRPGTATAWLAVVPAAFFYLSAIGGMSRWTEPAFLLAATAGFVSLAAAVPLFLTLGKQIARPRMSQ